MKHQCIKQIAHSLLFEVNREYNRYTLFDRPGPKDTDSDDIKSPTHPEIPLKPSEMMVQQNVNNRPPIEDEEFVPANPKELEMSVAAIAQLVPPEQTKFFYKKVQKLLDMAQERQNDPNLAYEEGTEEMKSPIKATQTPAQAAVKKESKNRIAEAPVPPSPTGAKRRVIGSTAPTVTHAPGKIPIPPRPSGTRLSATHVDTRSDDEYEDSELAKARADFKKRSLEQEKSKDDFDEVDELARTMAANTPDVMGFDEIAGNIGYAGAPGARQYIEEITQKLTYFAQSLNQSDIKKLTEYAVEQYQKFMTESGLVSDENFPDDPESQMDDKEVEIFSRAFADDASHIKDLDSFRFFFVLGFIEPGYSAVVRGGKRRLERQLDRLGVPQAVKQTVTNQVLGTAEKDHDRIKKRLHTAMASINDPEEIDALANLLRIKFPSLVKLASPNTKFDDDGFADYAIELWTEMGLKKQKEIFAKSLEETQAFNDMNSNILNKKKAAHGSSKPTFEKHDDDPGQRARMDTQASRKAGWRDKYLNMDNDV